MPIKLNGATSGSVELNVPAAVGSDLQLTLPATAGEVIVKATNGSVDLGNVDITAAGAATFGGGGTFASQVSTSDRFDSNRTSATDNVFNGRLNGTVTSTILANGSATFADTVKSSGAIIGDRVNGSDYAFLAQQGSVTKAEILANGSADFTSAFVKTTPASATTAVFAIDENSSRKVSFTGNGTAVFAGSVTASNVSDIRFKENITDANPQLADAVALGSQLKNFDWNDDAPLNEELRARRFLGLVAQEAEKVCPELTYTVPRTKQGKELTPEVVVPAVYEDQVVPAVIGEDGETVEPETTKQVLVTQEQVTPATYEELDDSYKAINHDILVMKLLGAVAELSTKVAALEASS